MGYFLLLRKKMTNISIQTPNNNIQERKYILDIIFNEFLGLEYKIKTDGNIKNWEIVLENNKKLIFEDAFFNNFPTNLEYLKLENVPKNVEFAKNQFIKENDIPIIYGTSTFNIQSSTLACGIDVFASSFFMLTRWEEYVNKNRDLYERFPATESLAYKFGFLNRAVVDEYVQMLKKMLLHVDSNLEFKDKKFQLYLTHDVDNLYMWKSWRHVARVALGDLLKRKSLKLAKRRFKEYKQILKKEILDPFDTFDWLMDKSEEIGLKSRFYFMSGGITEYDNDYNIKEKKALDLISKIQKRGHIIGFHPSFNAYNDFEQFKKEKLALEEVVGKEIVEGREHYLRFEVPTTWQIWEDNNMQVDSTCGYADKIGFRCGTGKEFSVFNILTRNKLKLKERPLICMDGTLFNYCEMTTKEAILEILKFFKHNSFTILWHNSYCKKMYIYDKIISLAKGKR